MGAIASTVVRRAYSHRAAMQAARIAGLFWARPPPGGPAASDVDNTIHRRFHYGNFLKNPTEKTTKKFRVDSSTGDKARRPNSPHPLHRVLHRREAEAAHRAKKCQSRGANLAMLHLVRVEE